MTKRLTPVSLDEKIINPCVQICVRDRDDGICLGCGRSTVEINNWSTLARDERIEIIEAVDERLANLAIKRRSRRTGRPKRQR